MSQPTKSELAEEVEELRASLDQAHGILSRALGYEELEGDEGQEEDDGEAE